MNWRVLVLSVVLSATPVLGQTLPPEPAVSNPTAQAAPDLTPGPDGKLSQQQMNQLTRLVADHYLDNYNRERDYTFVRHDVENTVDGNGRIKSTEIRTYDILQIYGEQVWHLVEKNDKPLDPKEAAKEDERIQKIIDKGKNASDDDRRKREEKRAKNIDQVRDFVQAIVDTHTFTLVGSELVDGRDAWIIDGEPRTSFDAHEKDATFVSKFRGRLWIDKSDIQLVKFDVEATDTASVGWVLARIHKGTRVKYERTRINDEVWMPKQMNFKLDARVALFKGYRIEAEHTYRDYKKFRTSTRIVGMGEVQEEK